MNIIILMELQSGTEVFESQMEYLKKHHPANMYEKENEYKRKDRFKLKKTHLRSAGQRTKEDILNNRKK